MDTVAIVGLAALLFVKEVGVPIPIPGDLLVLGAGVATAGNPSSAVIALVAILLAGYVGGSIQFLLVRGALRRALVALLVRLGMSHRRIESLTSKLRGTGARGVALARVTPGVRVPAIVASGLAGLPLPAFLIGLVIGNSLFVGGHFALGFVVGAPAVALVQASGLMVAAIVLGVLALIGAVGWLLLRRRRRAQIADGGSSAAETYSAWADAACPACLALAIIRPDERLSSGGVGRVGEG